MPSCQPIQPDTFVSFKLGNAKATARIPGKFRGATGEAATLTVDPGALSYFDTKDGTRF